MGFLQALPVELVSRQVLEDNNNHAHNPPSPVLGQVFLRQPMPVQRGAGMAGKDWKSQKSKSEAVPEILFPSGVRNTVTPANPNNQRSIPGRGSSFPFRVPRGNNNFRSVSVVHDSFPVVQIFLSDRSFHFLLQQVLNTKP
jgi:hypothetical protein